MTGQQSSSVFIHDDLRVLFRARRGGHPSGAPVAHALSRIPFVPATPNSDEVMLLSAQADVVDDGTNLLSGAYTRYRLRCDGKRPIVFEGILLVDRSIDTLVSSGSVPIRQEFSIYLTSAGKVYARIAMLVPDGVTACPLHKVAALSSAADLDQFIARYEPAEGWSWLAFDTVSSASSHNEMLASLRLDFSRLLTAALGARPIHLHS